MSLVLRLLFWSCVPLLGAAFYCLFTRQYTAATLLALACILAAAKGKHDA